MALRKTTMRGGLAPGVGRVNYQLGPEQEALENATRGRVFDAYANQAEEAARSAGASGVARRALMHARGATEGERQAMDMRDQAVGRDLQAQGLKLQNFQAGEQSRQFDTDFGLRQELGRGQLDLGNRSLDLEAELGRRGLDLEELLGMSRIDLDRMLGNRELDIREALGMGELGLGQDRLALDTILGTGQLGLARDEFDWGREVWEDEFGLAQEGQRQTYINSLMSHLTSLGINPLEYADIIDRIANGDYSALSELPNEVVADAPPPPDSPIPSPDAGDYGDFESIISTIMELIQGGQDGGSEGSSDGGSDNPFFGRNPFNGGATTWGSAVNPSSRRPDLDFGFNPNLVGNNPYIREQYMDAVEREMERRAEEEAIRAMIEEFGYNPGATTRGGRF